MPRQNINLLTTLDVQIIHTINARLIMQIAIAWILLLFLIYLSAVISGAHKQKYLDKLNADKNSLQEQFDELQKQVNAFENGVVKTDIPTTAGSVNIVSFYNHFNALAATIPDNTWLNNITLTQSDDTAILKGTTTNAKEILSFLEALSKTSSFKNKKFNQIQLQSASDDTKIPNPLNQPLKLPIDNNQLDNKAIPVTLMDAVTETNKEDIAGNSSGNEIMFTISANTAVTTEIKKSAELK